jgi:hypothetical protein
VEVNAAGSGEVVLAGPGRLGRRIAAVAGRRDAVGPAERPASGEAYPASRAISMTGSRVDVSRCAAR